MIEIYGDLWQEAPKYDAVCITTNGTVKSSGEAVMGRGCARQAVQRWSKFPLLLGRELTKRGNVVTHMSFHDLGQFNIDGTRTHDPVDQPMTVVTFPVKHRWQDDADIELIEQSARQLVGLADEMLWKTVLTVRPGCGNGRLRWADVRPVIEPLLDDRFTVIAKPHERYSVETFDSVQAAQAS